MATREDITRELLAGATPYQLTKKYPKKSVYRIWNELQQAGQLHEPGTIVVEGNDIGGGNYPFTPDIPTGISKLSTFATKMESEMATATKDKTEAEVIEIGPKSLPIEAVNRIRGVLAISARPKVLSMPTPELLYPAMVIAVTELGFPPMRPDDFIDTVLYQWLDACDIVPYAFMRKDELEDYAKSYGVNINEYVREHGLMTEQEFAIKYGISLVPESPHDGDDDIDDEDIPSDLEAHLDDMEREIDEAKEHEVSEQEAHEEEVTKPHEPTVGELLSRLHISNISKEVKDVSTGRTESIGSQGEHGLEE